MAIWYKTGTISLPNNSATVTGSGTAFVGNVSPGMMLVHNMRVVGEVQSVTSDTQLVLAEAYAGTAIIGEAYAIVNIAAATDGLLQGFRDLTTLIESFESGPLAGRFGDGTAAEPGIAFANDIDTGFYRPGENRIASTRILEAPAFGGAGVQSSLSDATAGRLMAVGAFGLGGDGIPVSATNALDNLTASGKYSVTSANVATVNGPAGAIGGVVDHSEFGSNNAAQIYTEVVAPNHIYKRNRASTGWGPWVRITAETGSNANGSYIRFGDGTQIVRGKTPVITTDNFQSGDVWGNSATITFPAAFTAFPTIVPAAERVGGDHRHFATIGSGGQGPNGAILVLLSGASTATGIIHYEASGFWA